ncbi:MAG: hypothetical protein ACJA08_000708 [Cyclobacteriaceae bacterium]
MFCTNILGVFLIAYMLNLLFHFVPTWCIAMPEIAQRFLDSIVLYLPILYVIEILIGLFLIINKWSAFLVIVLFPLTISLFDFHLCEWRYQRNVAGIGRSSLQCSTGLLLQGSLFTLVGLISGKPRKKQSPASCQYELGYCLLTFFHCIAALAAVPDSMIVAS